MGQIIQFPRGELHPAEVARRTRDCRNHVEKMVFLPRGVVPLSRGANAFAMPVFSMIPLEYFLASFEAWDDVLTIFNPWYCWWKLNFTSTSSACPRLRHVR